MAPLPPPQGMSEADYETIEAAVTETVRGRWFLGEFARRNRTAEMKPLLDAMARLEGMVGANAQPALPPADPSIRLLMQRIKEIAAQLEDVSTEMRTSGVDPRFAEAVDLQARAVAGMMRGPALGAPPSKPRAPLPPAAEARPSLPPAAPLQITATPVPSVETPSQQQPVRLPRADLPPGLGRTPSPSPDPRLAALSALDDLPLSKKLALFS